MNHCVDCEFYDFGYTNTKQKTPVMVCTLRPKRIYISDVVGERGRQYYYSAKRLGYCSKFQQKETNSG